MTSSTTRTAYRTEAMDRARLDGVELEYRMVGSGEPVLLIPPGPLADGFLPFLSEQALADRYRLIQYHRRGQAGSSRATPPVSYATRRRTPPGCLATWASAGRMSSVTPPERTSPCSWRSTGPRSSRHSSCWSRG